MKTFDQARESLLTELISDDAEVRAKYLSHFEANANEFVDALSHAFMKWRSLDAELQGNEKRAYISALVHTAISLHFLSLKLFLSGHAVAAGNLMRQVVETISLGILCSGKDLGILERVMEDKYSTSDAVRDLLRHSQNLGLSGEGVQALRKTQKFYHQYSHPTLLTMSTFSSFSERGGLYVGAAFDDGKIDAYRKEVSARVSLAKVFPNFVDGVIANVAKW